MPPFLVYPVRNALLALLDNQLSNRAKKHGVNSKILTLFHTGKCLCEILLTGFTCFSDLFLAC